METNLVGIDKEENSFNEGAFFDYIRSALFGGSMSQSQVNGCVLLGSACMAYQLNPMVQQTAYVLATAYHETAQTMQPIEEYGGWSTRYAPWYGRGFVQLTWEENYEKQQNKLADMDFVIKNDIPYQVHDDYNLALVTSTSAIITVGGMLDGDFTGVGLPDYITESSVDYVNARRIVNGTDKADMIAGYAQEFETAIWIGMGEEPPEQQEPALPYDMPVLGKGDKSLSVKILQQYLEISDDGDFGPATDSAVRSFQVKKELDADGIAGQGTWTALVG